MARPSSYTIEEDAILMETMGESTVTTNRLLKAAGYKERSADAISGRRYHLRNKGIPVAEADLATLASRRQALIRAVAETQAELNRVEERLREALSAELETLNGNGAG